MSRLAAGRRLGALVVVAMLWQGAVAGPLRDRWQQFRVASQDDVLDDETATGTAALPGGIRVMRDVPYGDDARQRFDVYLPAKAQEAPVIVLVHGGGWRLGDKAMRTVVENKVARWGPQGFIVVSVNYRLLPQAAPLAQAQDVARALVMAQSQVAGWGGRRDRFILMGHSAGAHLVALLAAAPDLAQGLGASPWLGTVALDSAAYDVPAIMSARHYRLYDNAFGKNSVDWTVVSPRHALKTPGAPFLAVCSSRREAACAQAQDFVAKASVMGMRAEMLAQDLSHRDINQRLGEASQYTEAVERFLGSLDASVATRLRGRHLDRGQNR